jgi:predicted Zn-dependent protease with MMP-like domain
MIMADGGSESEYRPLRDNGCHGPDVEVLRVAVMVVVEPERFEEMVSQALDGLPPKLGHLMRNVAVTVQHEAGPRNLLGLYQGVPLTERTSNYAGVLPDRITIYHQMICSVCSTEDEVVAEVRRVVVHEVGHHFGIDDERLHELGW